MIWADLHIHGKYSRGCSKNSSFFTLSESAKIKGLKLLGTGDFTHPLWLDEFKKKQIEGEIVQGNVKFVFQTEVNLVYVDEKIPRKVHLIVLSPYSKVKEIAEFLGKKTNLNSDGRPTIANYSCAEFVEDMLQLDDKIEIIPAHVWTPWFGIFGSKSGYNSLKEAFQDKSNKIHAIETGLSSDPLMNWRIKELQEKTILSFSDSHSYWPWRIGREATCFRLKEEFEYQDIIKAIRHNYVEKTLEVDPSYGKYHYDGHRKCGISLSSKESIKLNNICPVCNKPLTLGVEHRVEELSDFSEDQVLNMDFFSKKPYVKALPLAELIATTINKPLENKDVKQKYFELVSSFGSEFEVLFSVPIEEIRKKFSNPLFLNLLILNRKSSIPVIPGYDGVYGRIDIEKIKKMLQGSLSSFIS
ncbi:MAG: endonuclease Q family protein [Candidatus Woesearchaeota archaeon]